MYEKVINNNPEVRAAHPCKFYPIVVAKQLTVVSTTAAGYTNSTTSEKVRVGQVYTRCQACKPGLTFQKDNTITFTHMNKYKFRYQYVFKAVSALPNQYNAKIGRINVQSFLNTDLIDCGINLTQETVNTSIQVNRIQEQHKPCASHHRKLRKTAQLIMLATPQEIRRTNISNETKLIACKVLITPRGQNIVVSIKH